MNSEMFKTAFADLAASAACPSCARLDITDMRCSTTANRWLLIGIITVAQIASACATSVGDPTDRAAASDSIQSNGPSSLFDTTTTTSALQEIPSVEIATSLIGTYQEATDIAQVLSYEVGGDPICLPDEPGPFLVSMPEREVVTEVEVGATIFGCGGPEVDGSIVAVDGPDGSTVGPTFVNDLFVPRPGDPLGTYRLTIESPNGTQTIAAEVVASSTPRICDRSGMGQVSIDRGQTATLYLSGFAGVDTVPVALYESLPLELVDVVSVGVDDLGQGVVTIRHNSPTVFYTIVADPEGAMSSEHYLEPSDPNYEPRLLFTSPQVVEVAGL